MRKTAVVCLAAGLALAGCNTTTKKATGPGPTKVLAGVPTGYAHSQAGAVAAAAGYAGAVGSIALRQPEDRATPLEAMTAPDVLEKVRAGMEPAFQLLAKGIGAAGTAQNSVVKAAPLAYRVGGYNSESARVEIWAVAVVGNGGSLPPAATWGTTRISLRWVKGDWKLADLLDQSEGPTPQLTGSPTSADHLVTPIRALNVFEHVPALYVHSLG